MRQTVAMSLLLAVLLMCGGCCRKPIEPETITLDAALHQVAESLYKLQDALPELRKGRDGKEYAAIGLFPSEAEVTFNIKAIEQKGNEFTLGVEAPSGAPVGGNLGWTSKESLQGERGNTIRIKFSNALLAPEKTPMNTLVSGEQKAVDDINKRLDDLRKDGRIWKATSTVRVPSAEQ